MEITDINNCEREQLHRLGRIQGFGAMAAVHTKTLLIDHVSENFAAFFGLKSEILGEKVSVLDKQLQLNYKGRSIAKVVSAAIQQTDMDSINPFRFELRGVDYYLIINRSGHYLLLEFEEKQTPDDALSQMPVSRSIAKVLRENSQGYVLNTAVNEIKALTGYSRVMVYRFMEDGHGVVIAEAKDDDLQPFNGLHFPASDIPQIARDLYVKNMVRIIADVGSEPIAIRSLGTGVLDLTDSVLRAVSPMHIQYLKNMQVGASFSISLLQGDQLWGLIACQNKTPKKIDYKTREGSKLIGQVLSSALEHREQEDIQDIAAKHLVVINEISGDLHRNMEVADAMLTGQRLLRLTQAPGAALLYENKLYVAGDVPDEETIFKLANWFNTEITEPVFTTNAMPGLMSEKESSRHFAGICICEISRELNELVMWFKPEVIKTVNWAGKPEKPEVMVDGELFISPRNSFNKWTEHVKGTSMPWTDAEMSGVMRMRELIMNELNKRAIAISQLNERLREAYEELDTFSYTISHDLKTPIAGMKSFAELLLRNKDNDERTNTVLGKILQNATKMNMMVEEVLKLSKTLRTELALVPLDGWATLMEAADIVMVNYPAGKLVITDHAVPKVRGEQTMLNQVFANVVSNAFKYSSKREDSTVEIGAEVREGMVVFKVKDNGIGIPPEEHKNVFQLFKRLKNVEDIEGTGAGMAITKRILERINGKIWFESELGKGSVFYIALEIAG